MLEGRDSLVVLPTGGGKSLCYQAPAAHLRRLAVVVSPLIALMKDQVDGLRQAGVPAAVLNSSQTPAERASVMRAVVGGGVQLLYLAPERLVMDGFLERLQRAAPAFVAVDEAHCISQWGHDFRPEYRQLRALRQALPDVAVHAYTATATPAGARRHRHRAAPERSSRPRRLLRPAQPHLSRAAAHGPAGAGGGGHPAPPRPGRHRVLHPPQRGGGAGGRPGPPRLPGRALPRGPERRGAPRQPGRLRQRAHRHRGRHRRVRHGHRPLQRALRHPHGHAEVARALPAGGRPGGPRRPGGGVPAPGQRQRLRALEVGDGARRRRAPAGRAAQARRDVRVLPAGRVPPSRARDLLRPAVRRARAAAPATSVSARRCRARTPPEWRRASWRASTSCAAASAPPTWPTCWPAPAPVGSPSSATIGSPPTAGCAERRRRACAAGSTSSWLMACSPAPTTSIRPSRSPSRGVRCSAARERPRP